MKKYQGGGLMPRLSYNAPVPMYLGAPVDELKGTLDVLQNRYDSAQFAMAKTGDALANIASIPGSKDNAYVQQKIQEYEKMREEFSKKALEDPSVMHDALRMSQSFFSDPKFKTIQNSYEGYLNFNKIKQQLIAQGNYQDGLDPDITGWDSETMGVFNMAPTQWVDPKTFINENINNIEFDEDEYGNQYIDKTKIFNRAVQTYEQFLEHPSGKNWIKVQEKNLGRKMSDQEKEEAAFSYLNKEYSEILFRKGNMAKTGKGSSGKSSTSGSDEESTSIEEDNFSYNGGNVKLPNANRSPEQVIEDVNTKPEVYSKKLEDLETRYERTGNEKDGYRYWENGYDVTEEHDNEASNYRFQRDLAVTRKENFVAKQKENGKNYCIEIGEDGMPSDPSVFDTYNEAKQKVINDLWHGFSEEEKSGIVTKKVANKLNPSNYQSMEVPDPDHFTPEMRAKVEKATLDRIVAENGDRRLVEFVRARNEYINSELNPFMSSSDEIIVLTSGKDNDLLASKNQGSERLEQALEIMKTNVEAIDPATGERNGVIAALKNDGKEYKGGQLKINAQSKLKVITIGYNPLVNENGGYYVRAQVSTPDQNGDYLPSGEVILYDQPGQTGVSGAIHQYLGNDRIIMATAGPIEAAMQTGVNTVKRNFGQMFGNMEETSPINGVDVTFDKLSNGFGFTFTEEDGSVFRKKGFKSILQAMEYIHDEIFVPQYEKGLNEKSDMSTEDFNAEQQFRKLMGYDTPSGETQEEDEQSYDNPNYQSNSDPEWYKKYSKVDNDKKQTLEFAAKELEIDPAHLAQLIDFESGRTWDPAVKNKAGSGATGLIQFMPETAKRLGITTDELEEMDFNEQMEYVIKYVKMVERDTGIDIKSAGDIAMSIFFPAAVGKPNDWSIVDWYRRNKPGSVEKFITQNPGIETRGDYLKKAGIQS